MKYYLRLKELKTVLDNIIGEADLAGVVEFICFHGHTALGRCIPTVHDDLHAAKIANVMMQNMHRKSFRSRVGQQHSVCAVKAIVCDISASIFCNDRRLPPGPFWSYGVRKEYLSAGKEKTIREKS